LKAGGAVKLPRLDANTNVKGAGWIGICPRSNHIQYCTSSRIHQRFIVHSWRCLIFADRDAEPARTPEINFIQSFECCAELFSIGLFRSSEI
jgi:hypothetical protein